MLLLLVEYFRDILGWKMPSLFWYSSVRMFLAAATSLLFVIFLGPKFIRRLYELKVGQSIRTEDCPVLAKLHAKKKDIPTMGGVFILTSMMVSLLLWMDLKSSYTLLFAITTLWLGFLGGVDDYLKMKRKNSKGLAGRKKMGGQLLLAIFLGLYFFYPPFTNALHIGDWFAPPFAKAWQDGSFLNFQELMGRYFFPFIKEPIFIFHGAWILLGLFFVLFIVPGTSNAVNLTDGLDGLAAGCLVFASVTLALFAFVSNHVEIARYLHILYIEQSGDIAVYLSALIGACLGFLWFNGFPAQIIMGDTGSLALGGVLGLSAILLRREFLLALVGGIFVIEALSVILQVGSYRLRNRKRIFLCAPLHHHFECKGWHEMKVVLRFWIISFLLSAIGMASLKFQ